MRGWRREVFVTSTRAAPSPPNCPCCGHTVEDLDHIWWGCEEYEVSRRKFREILGKVAAKASPAEARIINDMDLWPKCLKRMG